MGAGKPLALFLGWYSEQLADINTKNLSQPFQAIYRDIGHTALQLRHVCAMKLSEFGQLLLAQPLGLAQVADICGYPIASVRQRWRGGLGRHTSSLNIYRLQFYRI